MRNAQALADRTNSGVRVHYQTYSTLVEPNLPPFSKEELASRLSCALKSVLADKIGKAQKPIIDYQDVDEDDSDEIELLSQSILISRKSTPPKVII